MPEDRFGISAGYGSFHGTNETAFGASYRRGRVAVKGSIARDSVGAGVMIRLGGR